VVPAARAAQKIQTDADSRFVLEAACIAIGNRDILSPAPR
jgi:hypothetical protein